MIGGNTNQNKKQSGWYSSWLSSTYYEPVAIQHYVAPIEMLVEEGYKRENLKNYILQYVKSHSIENPKAPKYPIPLTYCSKGSGYGLIQEVGCFYHDDDCDDDYNYNIVTPLDNSNQPCYIFEDSAFNYPNYKRRKLEKDVQTQSIINDNKETDDVMTSSFQYEMKEYKNSQPIIPGEGNTYLLGGIDELGVGIDLVTGKKKFQQLFDFTYYEERNWENPYTHSVFYYPDQVTVT